jgi:hypothetical protein
VTAPTLPDSQLAEAARIMREAMKSQAYLRTTRLGPSIDQYLRARRRSLAENSLLAYESTLHRLAVSFADYGLDQFEPPGGTHLLERFLDDTWGRSAPATYNRHLAVFADFFKFQVMRGPMVADPTLVIEKAKKREPFRTTFGPDDVRKIIAEQDVLRDRLALRLLLHYGLRRAGLQAVQFKHFDHVRKRLTVFLKGGKVRAVPIPEPAFWDDLGPLHRGHAGTAESLPDDGALEEPLRVQGQARGADVSPRAAQVVVPLPDERGHRPRGHHCRREDAQGPPHRRASGTRQDGQPEGGPRTAGPCVDIDHGGHLRGLGRGRPDCNDGRRLSGGRRRMKIEMTREKIRQPFCPACDLGVNACTCALDEPEEVCVFCNEPRPYFEFKDGLRCVYCAAEQDASAKDVPNYGQP